MVMYNPPHPGEFIKEVYLEPSGISSLKVALQLKVSLSSFSRLLKGQRRVSSEMALRLSKCLGRRPESCWDGFAGVRLWTRFNDKWSLDSRGDIGAGGSDFVWNVSFILDYQFRKWGSILITAEALDLTAMPTTLCSRDRWLASPFTGNLFTGSGSRRFAISVALPNLGGA